MLRPIVLAALLALAACGLPPDIVGPVEGRAPAATVTGPSPITARLVGTSLAEVAVEPQGLWLAIEGIDRALPGWVTDQETGRTVALELRPLGADGLDRISFDAARALGITQARLVIVDVYYDAAAL
ncbi:hypothetical protein [Roseobacter sp. HKCCA0434]|uniref:hypothetical protein n=1 Tax=Roseobacter sp. HKCCA0434 TaxID=3079297 RepID=UPI002905DC6D|nr:hypothetical protein [Roseobacter sp. HKCCA0434]